MQVFFCLLCPVLSNRNSRLQCSRNEAINENNFDYRKLGAFVVEILHIELAELIFTPPFLVRCY